MINIQRIFRKVIDYNTTTIQTQHHFSRDLRSNFKQTERFHEDENGWWSIVIYKIGVV